MGNATSPFPKSIMDHLVISGPRPPHTSSGLSGSELALPGCGSWYSHWVWGADRIVWLGGGGGGYNLIVWMDERAAGSLVPMQTWPKSSPGAAQVRMHVCVFAHVCHTQRYLVAVCFCAHIFVKFVLIYKCGITFGSSECTEHYPQVPVVILCTHICLFDTAPSPPLHFCISKTAVHSAIENGYRGERSLSAFSVKKQKKPYSPLPS